MDMNRCPQTEVEFTAYFFSLINRRIGGNANDWATVMSASYPWKGQNIQIPFNTPPQGQKHPSDAPFFGLSQQWSNGPKARIWIPSNTSDDGWYRRYIQYIKDGEVKGTFEWTWWYQSGGDYSPLLSDVQQPPTTEPPVNSDLEQRIATLERQVNALAARSVDSVQYDEKVAFQTHDGSIVCVDGNKGNYLIGNRIAVGAWETLTIKKV